MDDLTILNELHKGITMGMASIEEISKKTTDQEFTSELSNQYNSYQLTLNDVDEKFSDIGEIPDDTPVNQKIMGWTGIQFNTMTDSSKSKLSELLIQGYDMGIIKGQKLMNQSPEATESVKKVLCNFISMQEASINSLKKFL